MTYELLPNLSDWLVSGPTRGSFLGKVRLSPLSVYSIRPSINSIDLKINSVYLFVYLVFVPMCIGRSRNSDPIITHPDEIR